MTSLARSHRTSPRSAQGAAATPEPSLPARAGSAIRRMLEQASPRRARSELLRLAREHEASRPGLAARLRETAGRSWL
jgi:hypothetical protein